jgi:hypothetical protein
MPFGPPVDPSRSEIQPGQSGLRYDPDSGQYILVWKTDKTWTGTCRALVIRLADSTEHLAYFQFK